MKKLLCTSLSSLLVLGTLSSCSSKSSEAPSVTLPDVSTNTTVVTPVPEVTTPEVITEEEVTMEENSDEELELDATSSATIDYDISSAKVIQMEPYFIVADDATGKAYAIVNEFEEDDLAEVAVGTICEVSFVDIVYEEGQEPDTTLHDISAYFVMPITQGEDKVGAFMSVIHQGEADLSQYANIALDLSQVSNLHAGEKEALLWCVGIEAGENVTVFEATENELEADGYLEEVDGKNTFTDGVLITLFNNNSQPLSFEFEKETWFGDGQTSTVSGIAQAEIETGYFHITTNE